MTNQLEKLDLELFKQELERATPQELNSLSERFEDILGLFIDKMTASLDSDSLCNDERTN